MIRLSIPITPCETDAGCTPFGERTGRLRGLGDAEADDMATKTETIRARVEPELKYEAEAILKALGLSATDAITMFYRQVTLRRRLPFDVRLPNAETVEALQQAEAGEGLIECAGGLDELRERFG